MVRAVWAANVALLLVKLPEMVSVQPAVPLKSGAIAASTRMLENCLVPAAKSLARDVPVNCTVPAVELNTLPAPGFQCRYTLNKAPDAVWLKVPAPAL